MQKTLSYVVPVFVSVLVASTLVVLFAGSTVRAFSATTPFTVGTSSSTFFIVNDTGNVGVGTTTIANPGGFASVLNIAGTYPALTLQGARTYQIGQNVNNDIAVYDGTAGAIRMIITSLGNVGIATTTAVATLDIGTNPKSSFFANSSTQKSLSVGSASGIGRIGVSGTSQSDIIFGATSGGTDAKWFQLYNTSGSLGMRSLVDSGSVKNETLFLSNTGNVGVGTVSPADKLDVAGNVKIGSSSAPKGLTIYDDVTGSAYCLKMHDGVFTCTAGACQ